jgi:hypothetical protein
MKRCENCKIKFWPSYSGEYNYCQWFDCDHSADLCPECYSKCEYCKHCNPYFEESSIMDIKEMIQDEEYRYKTRLNMLNKILNKKELNLKQK